MTIAELVNRLGEFEDLNLPIVFWNTEAPLRPAMEINNRWGIEVLRDRDRKVYIHLTPVQDEE